MKMNDIRQMSREEIIAGIDEAQQNMSELRFKLGTSSLENPLTIRKARKNIARLKTALSALDLSGDNN
jgi:large subunit ribosomal protein L29